MDKRFFLALLLTMGVIVLTPKLFPGKPLPPATVGDSSAIARQAGTGAPSQPGAGSTVSEIARAAAETPPQPGLGPQTERAVRAEERVVELANPLARYVFTSRGGALLNATLSRYVRLAGDSSEVRLADGARPLVSYRLLTGGDTVALSALDFVTTQDTAGGRERVAFEATVGSGRVRIAYALHPENYLVDVSIEASGLAAPAFLLTDMPGGFDSQERDSTDDHRHLAYAMRAPATGAERIDFSKPDPGERLLRQGPFTWTVAKSKYFLVGLLAADSTDSPLRELHVTGGVRTGKVPTRASATAITPITGAPIRLELYAGPQQWERLVALGREFEHANPYGGFMNSVVQPFATIVMRLLLWMKRTFGVSYGWILVIFGVSIRLVMWPLNSRMMRSQIQMQRIAPQLQAAQAEAKQRFPGDMQRQQQMVMKVYADHGVSPFSQLTGCLPALLPMPVLFALFFVFQNTIEFRGVPFLWFPDISVRDPLYIVPFLTGGSMFFLSWLSMRNVPPNPQTKMMAWMMPIMMTAFGLTFAAGLNLYWLTQNIAALPQQWLISNERAKAAKAAPAPAVANGGGKQRR